MIGIFGGTFDPVHYGHIRPLVSVMQALQLRQVRVIPNRIPPHRETPWLNVEQRLALLTAALEDCPGLIIDQRELDRVGPSYMVDTLRSLKQDFPDESLVLIMGMDAFLGISSWYQWKSLFSLCHIVVTARPGFDIKSMAAGMDDADYRFLEERMAGDASELKSQTAGKILLQSVPQLDISSTRIREYVLTGRDVSQWMPKQACLQLREYI